MPEDKKCEYCHADPWGDVQKILLDSQEEIEIRHSPVFGWHLSDYPIGFGTEIYYCPMCGRKLEEQ